MDEFIIVSSMIDKLFPLGKTIEELKSIRKRI